MPQPATYTLDLIRRLIAQDLRLAQSDDELTRRIAVKGFGLRDTLKGRMLTTLPHGVEIGPLR